MAISKNYSVSRLKTFNSCPLKYKYTYVEGWNVTGNTVSNDIQKGLALHKTFEVHDASKSLQETYETFETYLETNPVDHNEYSKEYLMNGVKRFFYFWKDFIVPLLEEGWKVKKEFWVRQQFHNVPFIGGIDLLLKKDDEFIIVDYKTSSSTGTSTHKSQLLTYAYLLNEDKDFENIINKTKLYVFFPLGKLTKEYNNDSDEALSCLKKVKFTKTDLFTVIDSFESTIDRILEKDWSTVTEKDGVVQFDRNGKPFACKWCPYAGSVDNGCGFKGCTKSYEAGLRQNRTTKFEKD